jgi:acetyl esterase/lipase
MLSVAADRELYTPYDSRDGLSARPSFCGLVYPVITLRAPFDATSSRRMLVGDTPTPAASEAYSVERAVSAATPPTFLSASTDDPIVPVDNTLLMFTALRAKGVPTEMHLFERGGHGYNLGVPGSPPAAWPGLFAGWAGRNGFLKT